MTRIERTPNWRNRALCALPAYHGIDFFPQPGDQQGVDRAKAVCADCPVWRDCLTDALNEEGGRRPTSRYGIRGGVTEAQRFGIYKRTKPKRELAPCGTRAAYERHRKNGEPIDEACRTANRDRLRGYRAPHSSSSRAAS